MFSRLRTIMTLLVVAGLLSGGAVTLTTSDAFAAGGGSSVATATPVVPGAQEFGDTASASANPPNSPCGNTVQFWKVPLLAGDQVTVTGQAVSPASNIAIWVFPVGTTDASFTSGNFPGFDFSGSTTGGYSGSGPAGGTLGSSIVFTVPATGVYPVLIGQCNGQDGPYEFKLSVLHSAVMYSLHSLRTGLSGAVTAYVRSPDGQPIRDPALVVSLYGLWKDNRVVPASQHIIARAHVKAGIVRLRFHLPAVTGHKMVTLTLVAAGPGFTAIKQLTITDIVS